MCDGLWSLNDAQVACRQLGFPNNAGEQNGRPYLLTRTLSHHIHVTMSAFIIFVKHLSFISVYYLPLPVYEVYIR